MSTTINALVHVSTATQLMAGEAPRPQQRVEIDLAELTADQRQMVARIYREEDAALLDFVTDGLSYRMPEDHHTWANCIVTQDRPLKLDHPATAAEVIARIDAGIFTAKDALAKRRAKIKEAAEAEAAKKAADDAALAEALKNPARKWKRRWQSDTEETVLDFAGIDFGGSGRERAERIGLLDRWEELEAEKASEEKRRSREINEAREAEEKAAVGVLTKWAATHAPELAAGFEDGLITRAKLAESWRDWFRSEHDLGTLTTDCYDDWETHEIDAGELAAYREIEARIGDAGEITKREFYRCKFYEEEAEVTIVEYVVKVGGEEIECGDTL